MKKFVEVTLTELTLSDLEGSAPVIIAKLQRIINENQDAIDVRVVKQDKSSTKYTVKALRYTEQGN